ncbi:Glucose-methanol-choline oxidoreductase family protein isoform 1 [Theobroma cacao]|uniref:Glucose-methanol-choline oxidoreductase family protein isoform 1 n=1 Tax=Theobroma cacao TaxID=3641 RepID=A0A061EYF0_THECC|nr:Glucose-methanol-choline oxidoreductase family protein isoform 1 [Theobroma cacao]
MGLKYSWSSWRFLALVFVVEFAFHGFSYGEKAPNISSIQEATSAPAVAYYDYIIIGGGTAGCPLAATLSGNANVLVLERGGSPYVNTTKIRTENFLSTLRDNSPESFSEAFISEDGVPNNRPRALGGGTVINAGVYSHAETFFLKQNGMDEALANDSYEWVERKLVYKPIVLQLQSAVRDGLLEAGVLPYNGFTYDHINGTKTVGSILDRNGNRHTAADLLEYADPKRIKVYLHAVVHKITFTRKDGSRPKAEGVIFYDAKGIRHTALLKNGSMSEIISSAGAMGSPQLLLLSGIGPAPQLEALGIEVVLHQAMVGQGMADNPQNSLVIPSPSPLEFSLPAIVGITKFGSYIESSSGFDYSALSVAQTLTNHFTTNFNQDGESFMAFRDTITNLPTNLANIVEKVNGPISKGYLELRSTNVSDNPKVMFNYFQAPEDLRKCVQGMKTIINVVDSKSYSRFRYSNTTTQDLLNMMTRTRMLVSTRPNHPNSTDSLKQFCINTVRTLWHYHGGCQVGKVVDRDYKVFGVDNLRVIDGSTFNFSPGTNPQATLMMLGRYMGRRILQSRTR